MVGSWTKGSLQTWAGGRKSRRRIVMIMIQIWNAFQKHDYVRGDVSLLQHLWKRIGIVCGYFKQKKTQVWESKWLACPWSANKPLRDGDRGRGPYSSPNALLENRIIPCPSHAYRGKSGIACREETSPRSCHQRLLGASFSLAQSSTQSLRVVWNSIRTDAPYVCLLVFNGTWGRA